MTFYTYMWLREDGTPYYVGKGTGQRAFRLGCPPHERIILQDWPSEQDAFDGEKLLIAFYGRKDNGTEILRNLTDGGDAPPSAKGRKLSDATKEKHRKIAVAQGFGSKVRPADPKRHGRPGIPHSAEHTRKIAEAQRGKKQAVPDSAETRLKKSMSAVGNTNALGKHWKLSEKTRALHRGNKSALGKRYKLSAEVCARRSASQLLRWSKIRAAKERACLFQ